MYGVSFGAVSVAAGLSVLQTCALSLIMFTGASQFAFVGVAATGGAPVSGALTALMLGTRNTLYGLKLAPLLGFRGWRRPATAHLVIDESTAMSVTRDSPAAPRPPPGRPARVPQHRARGVRAVEPLHLPRRRGRQPDRRPPRLRPRRRGR